MSEDQAKIKVLHFSSRHEECGVAKYLAHHIKGMEDAPGIQNEYFDVSPYKTHHMGQAELTSLADELCKQLEDYDVLHIQHEYGMYGHDAFRRVVEAGKRSGKKVLVTVHISPDMHGASKKPRLKGLGPRSFMKYLRELRNHRHFLYNIIEPYRMVDIILAHNELTLHSLERFGIQPEHLKKVPHPVQAYDDPATSTTVAKALSKKPGDIIYACVGFLHRYKGMIEAVKALKLLPSNYKLAILGGMKADSDDVAFYDKLCDLMVRLGVQDRVYIAGYVHGDDVLNAAIRECDVCVYAYDRVYYAAVSSGSLNLAFANGKPTIAYPTATIKELAADADGAVVLCETFAYYELARELQRIDFAKQSERSRAYAQKMAWPKVSQQLVELYEELAQK